MLTVETAAPEQKEMTHKRGSLVGAPCTPIAPKPGGENQKELPVSNLEKKKEGGTKEHKSERPSSTTVW